MLVDRTYSLVVDLGDVTGRSCSAWVLRERCVGSAIFWVQSNWLSLFDVQSRSDFRKILQKDCVFDRICRFVGFPPEDGYCAGGAHGVKGFSMHTTVVPYWLLCKWKWKSEGGIKTLMFRTFRAWLSVAMEGVADIDGVVFVSIGEWTFSVEPGSIVLKNWNLLLQAYPAVRNRWATFLSGSVDIANMRPDNALVDVATVYLFLVTFASGFFNVRFDEKWPHMLFRFLLHVLGIGMEHHCFQKPTCAVSNQ